MSAQAQMKVSDQVAISIENMNKWYGTFHVLRDIDLTVYQGPPPSGVLNHAITQNFSSNHAITPNFSLLSRITRKYFS